MVPTTKRLLLVIVVCLLAVTTAQAREPVDTSAPLAEDGIPFKSPSGPQSSSSSRVVWVTLAAMVLALTAVWVVRKILMQKGWMPTQTKSDRIVLSGATRISPKLTVYLIAVDDKAYLVTHSGDQTSIIAHHEPEKHQAGGE